MTDHVKDAPANQTVNGYTETLDLSTIQQTERTKIMGLDMYLEAERYMSKYNSPELANKVKGLFPEMAEASKTDNIEYITVAFEVGYWRKANQIHRWFVDNCQDGTDDCRNAYVSRDNLNALLGICKKILSKSKVKKATIVNGYSIEGGRQVPILEEGKTIVNPEVAQGLLPTQEGFFFGGTDYNEWYLDDIKRTIVIIEKCLNLPKEYSFNYHSSW